MSGRRVQRSRKAGARLPAGAVYVGRPTMGKNPFKVSGRAAVALAQSAGADSWKGRQWAATRLFALWLADALGSLPEAIAADAAAELVEAGSPAAPTLKAIRAWLMPETGAVDVACWCPTTVDCHGDVLRAVAAGLSPLAAIGATPGARTSYRLLEASRDYRVAEIKADWRKRYRGLGGGWNPY
jgi:hypothetical protein